MKLTHLFPFSVPVKNAWSYAFTPQYVLMTRCLIKYGMSFRGIVLDWAQEQLCLNAKCTMVFRTA